VIVIGWGHCRGGADPYAFNQLAECSATDKPGMNVSRSFRLLGSHLELLAVSNYRLDLRYGVRSPSTSRFLRRGAARRRLLAS
jgi:hypothetical protein